MSTTATLVYVGHTTNPLTGAQGPALVQPHARELPLDFQKQLHLDPDDYVTFLRPQEQGFFWFRGYAKREALTLVVSDENGWFDYAQENGYARDSLTSETLSGYSVNNLPSHSKALTIRAFRGKRWESEKPFTEFVAAETTGPETISRAEKTKFPIVLKNGDYRLTVRRVTSGMLKLVGSKPKENLKQDDFLYGKLKLATPPEQPYTGIVYELDKRASGATWRGQMEQLLGDGFVTADGAWREFASVRDELGTTWITSFDGNRSGWAEIQYMETPLNLPANEGPFDFDFYLVEDTSRDATDRSPADIMVKDVVVPARDHTTDNITTTIKGVPVTIGLVGANTKVPPEFSLGGFSGASLMVSSPKPIPGIDLRVHDNDGHAERNDFWSFPTSDRMHYSILSFGRNQEPKDPFQPGTTVTLELRLPETLHFQFKAVPERP